MKLRALSFFSFTLLTLFLYPILPQYVYVVGGVNVVNALLLLFCVVYIFGYRRIARLDIKRNIIFFWIYMIALAISYFLDAGLIRTVTFVMSFILLPWFVITIVDSEDRFMQVIDTLIAAGFILGILGIIEAILKTNFIQLLARDEVVFFHEIRYGLLRIMGTFGQPIAYGLYQVFITALIYYRKNTSHHGRFLNVIYVVSVLNIFLSVSRIPIISLVVLQLLLTYRKSSKKFFNYVFFAVIIILLYLIVGTSVGLEIPFVDDLLETVNQLISGNSATTGSTVGVGNRLDLWLWVYLSMGNNWVTGHGPTAEFAYQVYEWQTKTSIENQYLYILWHNGIIGLILLVLSYVSVLRFTFKRRNVFLDANRERISFNMVMCITLFTYYIASFGVQESDMARIYTVFIALLIAYNRINSRRLNDENRYNGI